MGTIRFKIESDLEQAKDGYSCRGGSRGLRHWLGLAAVGARDMAIMLSVSTLLGAAVGSSGAQVIEARRKRFGLSVSMRIKILAMAGRRN